MDEFRDRAAPPRTAHVFTAMLAVAALFLTGIGGAGCATRVPADAARLSGGDAFVSTSIRWGERPEGWSDESLVASDEPHYIWATAADTTGGALATSFYTIPVTITQVTPRGQGLLVETKRLVARDAPTGTPPITPWFFFSAHSPRFPVGIFEGPRAEGDPPPRAVPICPGHFWLREPASGPARGVVIAFLSLGDPKYENSVIHELNRRGWAVIGTPYPFGLEFMFGPTREEPVTVEGFAKQSAGLLDARLAEWAYGCEAVLEDLAATRPDLAQRPLVLLGFSSGALGAPAAAARLHGRVDAAVLIGGGADMLRIVHTSHLFRNAEQIRWQKGPIPPDVLEELSAAYLEASRFDPYHTAAALARVPVLMLHAANDRIVPASTGEVLYERLGRPERWTLPMGHELMFWRLPAYAGEIADWIEGAVVVGAVVEGAVSGDAVRESTGKAPGEADSLSGKPG